MGTIGMAAQVGRFPFCLIAGPLSEKVGKKAISVPAAMVMLAAAVGLSFSKNNMQLAVFYILAITSLGAFYPPIQVFISQVSKRGELTKNLSAFNFGWCFFSATAAFVSTWLIKRGTIVPFYAAAICAAIAAVLVIAWNARPVSATETMEVEDAPMEEPKHLLFISRMGLLSGYFGWATVAVLFPKLGKSLKWDDSTILATIAMLMWGQAIGILAANASPWWRGKLWPQVMAQATMALCGVVIVISSQPIALGAAFFVLGAMSSVAYTAALYHGLSSRKNKGKNAGIHESIIAAANITGCLIGGIVAQQFNLRAPYIAFTVFMGTCLVITLALSTSNRRA